MTSQMTATERHSAFVEEYEQSAEPLTAGIAAKALQLGEPLVPGMSVIDIGAGTGAFTMLAAETGAHVMAIDFAEGMVDRLRQRLASFEYCEARHMDGQALALDDDSFDMAASFFGIITFPDWRKGLREMIRVTKPGGRIVVATWPGPDGAGPAAICKEAFRRLYPQFGNGGGSGGLFGSDMLANALGAAGCSHVKVATVTQEWGSVPLDEALALLEKGLASTPLYAGLDSRERQRLREPLMDLLAQHMDDKAIIRVPAAACMVSARKPL